MPGAYEKWLSTFPTNTDLTDWREWRRLDEMSPKYNLVEHDTHFEYNFDVPGVRKEDIHIHEKDGVLTITGTRHAEKKDEKEGYSYRETSHGEFTRSVKLDDRCNLEDMKADLLDGVLKIRVGKSAPAPDANVRKININ